MPAAKAKKPPADSPIQAVLGNDSAKVSRTAAELAIRMTPPTQAELIQRHLLTVHIHIFASAGYIKRLDERGHIERVPNPADGRSTLIELSATGLEIHGAVAHQFGTELKRFNDILRLEGVDAGHLTDQLQLFQRLMEQTLEELE